MRRVQPCFFPAHAPRVSLVLCISMCFWQALLVFVGEGGQYHVPKSSVAPFIGTEEDPHMPKAGKQAQVGLLRVSTGTNDLLSSLPSATWCRCED